MAIYFIDSSALVKRYISEVGSTWVLGLFDPTLNNEVFIAAITGVEIIAAITRRSRSGSISIADARLICNQFKTDLQKDYQIVEITEAIINLGMVLSETYGLRGYDAIQLAAGCAINTICIANGLPPMIFVSADNELNGAVVSEGLTIENPNNHP
ncbi:MAG TPA: nucleic acid-binding protein [Cyanobacteria bacterium UBA11149]|nr:nucleic acid-binding protein [Cyanobacteria bacterium UBA11367]HBE59087.1 nucleic acid-binding protein [Cyanobacteria bacterium UBA11366]HBK64127.1 nucleic acid-binding protein [Cyanobacteria bacterium UBA11166]HBR72767.1 nucleic acid-binding protein [Cyanobacteria bacterium UBA11159]HBS67945.1 nucleic acid-binding protein [Cyanobacteria bacterium UBA11153]HBW87485.1 nucleic acid-binding protein [Cyanobacteria bacterium UBA11149]HCA94053.1 nucleic acid-binding protein [Cyanobacteria bacter